MLQYKTIPPETLHLLKDLQSLPILNGTRLVGGTALALQLGHRKSIDLDLFGTVQTSSEELREVLSEGHTLTIGKESKNIHVDSPFKRFWKCIGRSIRMVPYSLQ